MALTLFAAFLLLMLIGVPVAFALGIAAWGALLVEGRYPTLVIVKEMFTGLDSFPLMAVPFFVLAAELMTGGAMTAILLRFAAQFVGHLRGGLGHANILSSMLFSGISGSALADAAGPGALMMRMMEEGGYRRGYAGALTASAAVMGPIIPPSIIMIIYAMQVEAVSVGALFVAGLLPGLLIALALALANALVSRRRGYRSAHPRPPLREIAGVTLRALPALALIGIVIGGIRTGIFTPTEASVIAVFYALGCGMLVYRSLKPADLPRLILNAALASSAILMILAGARAFAWVLIIEGVPQAMAGAIAGLDPGPLGFLLAVNLLLLLFGLFLDPLPGVMILTPILAPVAAGLGIDPIHFAIVMILNLTLGMITPPVGSLLFVVAAARGASVGELVRDLPPFYIAHLAVLVLVTLLPGLSTWLPRLGGF